MFKFESTLGSRAKIVRFATFSALIICGLISQVRLCAQEQDSLSGKVLEPVTVTSARIQTADLQAPLSLSLLRKTEIQTGRQQLSAAEMLAAVPGLFSMNTDNYAQDLRISIRGVGSRAAFGIRGIRIMTDDLPESTPDGQGQVDNLVLGLIERAEIIRGPVSALYGNAAGGVISFYTEDPPERRFVEAGMSAGSFGFQQYQLKTGGSTRKLGYVFQGNYLTLQGYRDQSATRNLLLNTKIIYHPSTKDKLILLLNYANSPQADDAGALTKIQADTMPQMARDVNLRFDAGESLQQGRAGLIWEHKLDSRQQLKAKVFYTGRDFENKLAFANSGIVHLGRNFTGGGLSYIFQRRFENTVYRLQTGLEIEDQRDLRQRYQNENGVRGALVFDQLEKFQTTGLYALNSLNIRKKFEINASLRFDLIHYTAEDHFTTDGDDSGSRTLQNLSPGIGLCYEISHKLYVFANYSTSFETPALSELSANPDGGGGFNTGLNPQRSNSFEAGIRGLPNARLRFELTAFRAYGRDELAPYELPAFPGRVFYRNSAQSSRKGLEADVQWIPFRNWILHSTYSLGDYRYVQYSSPTAVFDGKHMPVLPKHIAFAELGYRRSRGLFTFVQYRYTGSMYADDGNQTAVNASFIWALRGGYRLSGARFDWELFGGINNLFDTFYYNNIRPNAAAARYYEPGAGRNFYVGLRLNLHQNKAHE